MIKKTLAFTLLMLCISVFNSYGKVEASWVAFSGNGTPSPAEIRIVDEFNKSMTIEVNLYGINVEKRIQDGEQYQFISIPDSDWLTDIGKPKLPIVRSLFTIPSASEIALEIESEDYNVLSDYKVYPVGKPVVKNGRNNTVYIDEQFTIDRDFYASNVVYPQETAKISFSGYLRDQRIVQLEFRPIKYNPSTKELFYSNHIVIRLSYKDGFAGIGLLKNLYNGSETFSLAPSKNNDIKAMGSINYVNDLMQSRNADYIIIAPESFYNNTKIKQLAEWRSQYSGLDVAIVSYDKIYHTFGAGQRPDERIKAFMQHAYYYWKSASSLDGHIRYVLIIGDVEFIPTHISDNISFGENIATDNWYACLSGDDEMPDVMIGRLPVKTINDLNIMVDKIIQYEQNPIYSDWANNALLVLGTVDYLGYDLITARDEYLVPSGFNVTEVSGLSGGTSGNVVSELNKGQYILDYAGHGYIDGWEIFSSQDIQKLKNDRMLPAIFSLACSTGYFDHPDKDSFAEAFVKAKNGAIAFFGGSRLVSPSSVGFALSRAIAGSHLYTLGEIAIWTKLQLISNSNDLELYNLLGDPALDLGAPRRFPNMPDIVITPIDISFKPEVPKHGETITIKATINNFGAISAQNVEVEFRDDGPEGLLIAKKTIPNINSMGSINAEINWDAPFGIPLHNIYIKAYLKNGSSEYWTKNNYAQKQIYVSIESPGFPVKVSDRSLSPVVAGDIDNDNEMEILFQSYSYDRYTKIYAFHKDGQPVNGWQKTITNPKFTYEVQYINSSASPVPSIGDLDGDGKAEVVAVFYSQLIHAWKGDGTYISGFPVQVNGYATTTPVLADMDKDGKLDIVVGTTSGQVYVIKYDGSILAGFPTNIGKKAHLFVSVNDLDNDGDLEIIALDSVIPRNYDPSGKSTIYAWHHDGTSVKGWPVQMQGSASILPLVTGDLDGDGKAEVIAVASNNTTSRIYIWNADGTLKNICQLEPDDQIRSAISLADIDGDGDIEIIAGSYYGIIYAWHHDGRKVYGFPINTDDGYNLATPIIGDIDGDEKLEIISTAQNGSISAYKSDGTPVLGWQNVVYENMSLSAPMITDLDGDMKAELVYTSDYGLLHNLSLIGRYNGDNQFGWYMFQRDQRHTGSYSAKGILPQSPLEIQAVDYPNDKGGAILITWKSPVADNINSYIIYRAESSNGKYSIIGKAEKTESSYIDNTTKNGVLYWYIVRSSDGVNLSANITPVSAYSFNNYAPNPPSYVFASNTNIDGAINVSWYPISDGDIGGYKVFYGKQSKNYDNSIDVGLADHITIVGLENDKEYYVCVSAYDKDGNESLTSTEVIGIPRDEDTDPPVFSSFYPTTVVENADFYIRCNITDPSGIYDDDTADDGQGVYLVWWIDGKPSELHTARLSKLSSGEFITNFRIPGQPLGTQIFYQVYAYDDDYDENRVSDRTQGISEKQTITVVQSPKLAYNYPNPAPSKSFPDRTIFRYYANSNSQISINIYDISGHIVGHLESETAMTGYSETEWNISDIASGVYIYTIEIKLQSGERKFVKDKLAIIR